MQADVKLQQAVLAELEWEPSVHAGHIGVTARDGIVTLFGHVENFAEKHGAEMAARRVKGAMAVAEEIEVQIPFERTRGDDAIAAAAIERLAWDSSVENGAISIKVEAGWVTLSGEVQSIHQKDAAMQDIRGLLGIVGVSNQITVKSDLNATNICNDIEHALQRSWLFDAKTIRVAANGGCIRLSGTVPSLHDWELATAVAWSAPGASSVQNDMVIG